MIHLRRFNENRGMVNDIFNIARDEGLSVTTPADCKRFGMEPVQYYIDLYPMDDHGNINSKVKVLEQDEFVKIVRDIYDRLDNEDLIDHSDTITGLNKEEMEDINAFSYTNSDALKSEFVPTKIKDPVRDGIVWAGIKLL